MKFGVPGVIGTTRLRSFDMTSRIRIRDHDSGWSKVNIEKYSRGSGCGAQGLYEIWGLEYIRRFKEFRGYGSY